VSSPTRDQFCFQRRLADAFPDVPFEGQISVHDECEEGRALRSQLPHKSWRQISSAFIEANSLSLPLLEPPALVAFLPAWLARSAVELTDQNLVLEFMLYVLSPHPQEPSGSSFMETVGAFSDQQRGVVCAFLDLILSASDLEMYHEYARRGKEWWCKK